MKTEKQIRGRIFKYKIELDKPDTTPERERVLRDRINLLGWVCR